MTTETAKVRTRKSKASALDLPMSAFAAVSVAFAAFAMPDDLFSDIISASGLPSLLAAAQPPLGATARTAVIAAAFGATFALVFLLLRALGKPAARPVAKGEEAAAAAPPRLRRADSHPDAPPRRPLFAGKDLGEPIEQPGTEESPFDVDGDREYDDADWERTLPGFITAAETPAEDPEPKADLGESVEQEAAEQDPYELVGEAVEDPEAREDFAPASEAADEDEANAEREQDSSADYKPRLHFEPEPETAQEDANIPHLMQRLEHGLVRRKRGWNPLAEGQRSVSPADDRLKSAIEDLQRMARRSA